MKFLCILMLAAFIAMMFAVYPDKPAMVVHQVSDTKPVILHRDAPPQKPAIYDVFFADEIPAEIPKPSLTAKGRMNHYLNKVTISTNPSKQQYAALSRNERMH